MDHSHVAICVSYIILGSHVGIYNVKAGRFHVFRAQPTTSDLSPKSGAQSPTSGQQPPRSSICIQAGAQPPSLARLGTPLL